MSNLGNLAVSPSLLGSRKPRSFYVCACTWGTFDMRALNASPGSALVEAQRAQIRATVFRPKTVKAKEPNKCTEAVPAANA